MKSQACVLLLALIQPAFALKMQNAAAKSDPVWDASGSASWQDQSDKNKRGTKASVGVADGERKRFKITITNLVAENGQLLPAMLGVADETWESNNRYLVEVTRNGVWGNSNDPAIMVYTDHPTLRSEDKIHERTDRWSGNQEVILDVDMVNRKLRWVSIEHNTDYTEARIPDEFSTVYPVVYNANSFPVYHIANFFGNDDTIPNLEPNVVLTGAPSSGGGKAGGDPHVRNIRGERFNINREGYAPLVSITSQSTAHLEVMALVEGVKKCQKKMFITRVNSSGAWLEKNVAVSIPRDQMNSLAFSVTVDGQEVWSPAARGYQPPRTANTVFHHANKFSIDEMATFHESSIHQQPGMELKTAHDVKIKMTRPLHRSTAPPHLNVDVQGIQNLPASLKVGGLLGDDDHSHWSSRNEECVSFVHTFGDADSSRAFAN